MIKEFINPIIETLEEASAKILEIYSQDFSVKLKSDNSPVTEADMASSRIIIKALEKFNIPIISEEEENPEYHLRKNEKLIWLVDPLDGTREFINKNDQFCICVALVENGKPILGFIASPTDQQILFGSKEIGAIQIPFFERDLYNDKWKINSINSNSTKVLALSNAPISNTSRKFVTKLENQFGELDFIRKGSALKFIDLVNGKADIYFRQAPTMEWDIAAGQAIYEAMGGEVINFETKAVLTYNKPTLKNPHFIAKLKTTKLN
jgi:3'(2'), 5'-bisphosphate nucleotidase